jgi:phosphatidate cytidylyltransferase
VGDLGVRLISGIFGLVLLVGVLLLGGTYLSLSILILSLIALREFYNAVRKMGVNPFEMIGYSGTVLLFLRNYFGFISFDFIFSIILIASLAATVIIKEKDIKDSAITITGVMYIPFLLFHILYLDGSIYLWLVFLIAFGTDTFAYIVGSKFGKKKLCPEISPKKSVEGAVGGIIGSIIVTIIYSIFAEITPLWSVAILALAGSIISQLGDLTASRIKRAAGIKDYGKIMPGHGGMMDRFDSIIFTAPIVYYYAYYFFM